MALSTLQNYSEYLIENFGDEKFLEHIYSHKWSILAGTFAVYQAYKYLTRPKNLPPGPRGLPLVGAMFSLTMNMHLDCLKWTEKYKSDVVSFYLGRQLNVILNSADVIKTAFVKSTDFANRDLTTKEDIDLHEELFGSHYSEEYKKLKSFMLASVKKHGFGTPRSEENMKRQLTQLIGHLETLPDGTIDHEGMKRILMKAAVGVIMKIIANQEYTFDDADLEDLMSRISNFMEVLFRNGIISMFLSNIFPAFIMWIIKKKYTKDSRAALDHLRQFFKVLYEDHKSTLDMDNSRDFMDDVLIYNAQKPMWSDLQMTDSVMIITPDAIDTTSNQIGWVLFYICWHPEVQDKMVAEIQKVCGDRMPEFKDRSKLVYCEGAMLEGLRMSSIACLSGPHINIEQVELNGFTIPKNTQVQANLYAYHFDEKIFPEAEKFKPERFVSSEGKLVNSENVVAFSTGHRKCVGESLTKSQTFYYMAGLVQKFQLSFVEGHKPETMDTDNMYRAPPKHKMKVVARY